MSQTKLFLQIWHTRKHISFVSGQKLTYRPGQPYWFNYFAHVLSKGQFPSFKFEAENIILLTPQEHYLYDFGSKDQRNRYAEEMSKKNITVNWDKLYELRDELRKKYNERTL